MTSSEGSDCVVTGASSGIGRALALALARRGDRVWAIARRDQELQALVQEAASGGAGSVVPVPADLSLDDDLEAAAQEILATGEQVDTLIHCAGAIELGTFDSLSTAALDRQYRVNLRAPYALTRALLPGVRRARGQVVFVNSSAGLRASASNAVYAATKHGLRAIADGLREQVGGDNVRVVSVYVGRTATPMQQLVHEHEGRAFRPELLLSVQDVVSVVLGALAAPPGADVTDVHVRPASKLPPL